MALRSRFLVGLGVLCALVGLGSACAPGDTLGGSEGSQSNGDPVVDCSGLYGTTPSPDGTYYITAFGCYTDGQGNTHGDPGDNCIPGCISQAQKGICSGLDGKSCEEEVNWYAADSGRFGCMTRLRVTNPKNGKSVVVVVLDAGPSCFVERNVDHAVLDMSPPSNLYLFGGEQGQADKALVDVEVVDPSTPLGPDEGSSSSSSGGGSSTSSSSSSSGSASSSSGSAGGSSSSSSGAPPPSCTAGGVDGTCLDTGVCAAMGYVSTPGLCPGPASEQCCTPPSSSSSSSSSSSGSSSGGGTPCASDGDCNPGNDGSGMICEGGVCVPGCHSDAQCPGSTSCLGGQCQ